jgi:hypothetical protein
VLEHLLDVQRLSKSIVLKPGGWLLVTLPNRDWFTSNAICASAQVSAGGRPFLFGVRKWALLAQAGLPVRRVRGGKSLFRRRASRLFEKLALAIYPRLHRRMKRMMLLAQKLRRRLAPQPCPPAARHSLPTAPRSFRAICSTFTGR